MLPDYLVIYYFFATFAPSFDTKTFFNAIINHTDMKVKVSVYKADDGSYWCHTEKDVYGTVLNGQGNSVAEAKQDLYACLEEAKEDYVCQGKTANPVEFEYVYDLQSFFEYFSVFNVTEVARRAGINPTLMRQYTSGVKKAGEKTYAKLSACINDIRRDIISASF